MPRIIYSEAAVSESKSVTSILNTFSCNIP